MVFACHIPIVPYVSMVICLFDMLKQYQIIIVCPTVVIRKATYFTITCMYLKYFEEGCYHLMQETVSRD